MATLADLISTSYGYMDNNFAGHDSDKERAIESIVEAGNQNVTFSLRSWLTNAFRFYPPLGFPLTNDIIYLEGRNLKSIINQEIQFAFRLVSDIHFE